MLTEVKQALPPNLAAALPEEVVIASSSSGLLISALWRFTSAMHVSVAA
jgi:hypothetical protein